MQSQYWSIDLMPGLMLPERELLKAQGISDTGKFLQRTHTPELKLNLASTLKLNQKHLNKWIALADLGRIPSVGSQYCGLVLHAGIISVAQLSRTPYERLHRQIARLQAATIGRPDLTPPVTLVKQWTEQAQMLCRS